MLVLKSIESGRYRVYLSSEGYDVIDLIKGLENTPVSIKKGRAGIKIFYVNNIKIACRQYRHGGLLRKFTGDFFISKKRAIQEMEVLLYLFSSGIPAVRPVSVIEERNGFFKRLYILTIFEDNTENLLEFLSHAQKKTRMRMAKKLAILFFMLESVGIYHPDLHLDNILVKVNTPSIGQAGLYDVLLMDFDRAVKKTIKAGDMEKMFWRLNRYIEKMEKKGKLRLDGNEKILFLRTYERLAGRALLESMRRGSKKRSFISRIGWAIESLLYKT